MSDLVNKIVEVKTILKGCNENSLDKTQKGVVQKELGIVIHLFNMLFEQKEQVKKYEQQLKDNYEKELKKLEGKPDLKPVPSQPPSNASQ